MKKVSFIILFIFFIINITGCNSNQQEEINTQNSELKEQVSKLEIENDQLNNQVENLSAQNNEFLSKINQLEQSNETLNEINVSLEALNEQLSINITPAQEAVGTTSITATSDVIESKIDGSFEGWDGETIFKLMNGQIWQQTSYDYIYRYSFMPDVVIYKSGYGYKMSVDGVDSTISVKRLK